jgi:opacity protein-like surface antigen
MGRDSRLLLLCACAALAIASPAAADNPFARPSPLPGPHMNGAWNGVNIERRSQCSQPQNNGSRGTYAEFDVSADNAGNFFIAQRGITGLDCTYTGRYEVVANRLSVEGTYNCTDGKQGTFRTTSIDSRAGALNIRMDIRLTGTETCAIEGVLGLARLDP